MPGVKRPKTATTSVVCTLEHVSRHKVHKFLERPRSCEIRPPARPSVEKAYSKIADANEVRIYIEVAKRCMETPEILQEASSSPRFQEAMKRQGLTWEEIDTETDRLYKTKLLTDVFMERKRVVSVRQEETTAHQKRRFNAYIDKLNEEEETYLRHETRRQNAAEKCRDKWREMHRRNAQRAHESFLKSQRRMEKDNAHGDYLKKKAAERAKKVKECFEAAEKRQQDKVDDILERREKASNRLAERREREAIELAAKQQRDAENEKIRQERHLNIEKEKQAKANRRLKELETKMERSYKHKETMAAEIARIKEAQNLAMKHRQHHCLRLERKQQYYLAKKAEDIEVSNLQRVLQQELRVAVRSQRRKWEKKKQEFELKQAKDDKALKNVTGPGPGQYNPFPSDETFGPKYTMPKGMETIYSEGGPGPADYAIDRELRTGVVKWYEPKEALSSLVPPPPAITMSSPAKHRNLSPNAPHLMVSPRPAYPQPGPGAYSIPPPRPSRTVDQVMDDFGLLCLKYSERIEGSPKMRARSASILHMPSERKELNKLEGFAPRDSRLDRALGESPNPPARVEVEEIKKVPSYKNKPASPKVMVEKYRKECAAKENGDNKERAKDAKPPPKTLNDEMEGTHNAGASVDSAPADREATPATEGDAPKEGEHSKEATLLDAISGLETDRVVAKEIIDQMGMSASASMPNLTETVAVNDSPDVSPTDGNADNDANGNTTGSRPGSKNRKRTQPVPDSLAGGDSVVTESYVEGQHEQTLERVMCFTTKKTKVPAGYLPTGAAPSGVTPKGGGSTPIARTLTGPTPQQPVRAAAPAAVAPIHFRTPKDDEEW